MNEFFQKNPFLRLLLALVAGIAAFRVAGFSAAVCGAVFALGALLVVFSFLQKNAGSAYRRRWIFGAGAMCVCFAAGFFSAAARDFSVNFPENGKRQIYLAEVEEFPRETPKSYKIGVSLHGFWNENDEFSRLRKSAIVYFPKDSVFVKKLLAGQMLLVQAAFSVPEADGNPEAFDYAQYLRRHGVAATAFVSEDEISVLPQRRFLVKDLAEKCRQRLLDVYRENNIEGEEFAVLAALTLGYKDELSDELRADFANAGVTHILAVSGLHVGVVYFVLYLLLSVWGGRRAHMKAKTLMVILFLVVYAFVTGLSPSVVRSSLMFSLVGLGMMLNRKATLYNTVFLSAFIMLIFNPDYLYDVGFLLSYSAVLSIVFFVPFLSGLIATERRPVRFVWELFCVSLAAQLGTMPVSLYCFHQFPTYFWFANLVVVPLSSLVIYATVALFFVSWIPVANAVAAFILTFLLKAMNLFVAFVAWLPHSSVADIGFGTLQLWLLAGAVFCLMSAFSFRNARLAVCFALLVAAFSAVGLYDDFRTLRENKMIVFSSRKCSAMLLQQGRNARLFASDSVQADRLFRPYKTRRRLSCPPTTLLGGEADIRCETFCGKTILSLAADPFRGKIPPAEPLEVDFLLVRNDALVSADALFRFLRPRCVVVEAAVPDFVVGKFAEKCRAERIPCHSVAENGVFVAQFLR